MFHEFIKFNLLATIFIVYIISILLKITKFNISDFKRHIAIYSALCFVFVLNLLNGAYINWFTDHVTAGITEHKNYIFFLQDYFQAVLTDIIVPNIYLLITIAVLIICIPFFVADKNKNKKIIAVNVSLLLSMLIFIILSIMAGDNHDDSGQMIPQHFGIKTLFVFSFIYIIYSLGGYLYAYSEKIKISAKNIITGLVFSSAILFFFNSVKACHNDLKDNVQKVYHEKRTNIYIMEKTYVLNKKYGQPDTFICYCHLSEMSADSIYYVAYFYENNGFDTNSYSDKITKINVCNTDDVMTCRKNMLETVKQKLGYTFTEEELKNPDFKSLFKLNYDLNGIQKYNLK